MGRKGNGTFCPRLWEEVYIDEKGNVFACCHNKPAAMGSIYENPLADISDSEIARKHRRLSLEGRLRCYPRCNLLSREERSRSPLPGISESIEYDQLRRLKILFGEACNIDCIMCWQDSRSEVFLDVDRLIENVDIKPFEGIELQGGEPLYIEGAKRYFDHLASLGKKISFLTNGTIMTEEWAEKIARHSAFIYFSLNAATRETHELVNSGSRWDLVLRNIERVRQARDRLGTDLNVMGHMTIVTKNLTEIPLFIRDFPEFGFDSIDFGFDLRVPFYLKLRPGLRQRLRRATVTALATLNDTSLADTNRLEYLGLV